ncbi:unnamed protein product [Vitrella brassicaformis CCMP3155]|uniref:Uncharacterized protein n=2 Tax=Vitrella brassicaformis TaxID=1169539 RepID=A0A0G4EGV7_VITBC|nr:unnamed protein product [Vitrella brassicaformis CCMP3155]|eukprot:CEL94740.1 unnamed protein product [Vitrella brassicaformis CCMP3155]
MKLTIAGLLGFLSCSVTAFVSRPPSPSSWRPSGSLSPPRHLHRPSRTHLRMQETQVEERPAAVEAPSEPEAAAEAPKKAVKKGKQATFGLFSPAVLIGKLVLGDKQLNKVRGKIIALHSQVITQFCDFTGAQRSMRQRLIKKAKTTGDRLGMLI